MKRTLWRFLLMASLAPLTYFAPSPANAFLCTPILGCTCSASATALAFSLQPLNNNATNSTADITVSCTGVIDALPSVAASFTTGQSGLFSDRVMNDGIRLLHYNFYTDANRTLIAALARAARQRWRFRVA
jgi:spore coat protein U-like protein